MIETFGEFELVSLLGAGGMGEVYRARSVRRQRVEAVKRLPQHLAQDEQFVRRFRRECEIAGRLEHEHIVPTYDFGTINETLFISMRLIEGEDVAAALNRGPMPVEHAATIVSQIGAALDHAHRSGVEHRDIKPSNILLAQRADPADQPFAYLTDFGIARASGMSALTQGGSVAGTIAYLAPERIDGSGGDTRADVYSLACVLFQMLTGSVPFPSDTDAAVLYAHLHADPPSACTISQALPSGVDAVLARGMSKRADLRFKTAGEFATAARAALTTAPNRDDSGRFADRSLAPTWIPVAGTPTAPIERMASPARRRRRAVPALVLILIAAVIGIVVVALHSNSSRNAPSANGTEHSSPSPPKLGNTTPAPTGGRSSAAVSPAAVLQVGTCLNASSEPISCDMPHLYEVYAASTPCGLAQLLHYLGGELGTDTLLSTVTTRAATVDGQTVCLVHGPQASGATGSARMVLTSDDDGAWRRCNDSLTRRTVPCNRVHTSEFVYFAPASPGTSVNCDDKASAYLESPIGDHDDELRVDPRAVSTAGIACTVSARGDNVLTGTLRRLGQNSVPAAAR